MLKKVALYIRQLAFCFVIGEMLFFITIFAPRVFKVLERPQAAALQSSIFPAYYFAGLLCTFLIFVSYFVVRPQRFKLSLGLSIFVAAVFSYSLWSITPTLIGLQPILYSDLKDPQIFMAAQEKFKFLHKLSVQLNAAALLSLLVILGISFNKNNALKD